MTDGIRVGLIWAQARGGVIGAGGVLPWHLPEDLAHFREVTLDGPVVMGRRTWESIPERFRPLPGRRNIVVTRDRSWAAPGAEVAHSADAALALCAAAAPSAAAWSAAASPAAASSAASEAVDSTAVGVWVIGGAELFAAVIERAHVLEITEIDADIPGDTLAPVIDVEWALVSTDPAAPGQAAASDPADAISPSDPAGSWHVARTGLPYRFLTFTRLRP